MVPGMTERDRLAADVRLCMWLADATLGPTLKAGPAKGAGRPSVRGSPLSWRLVRDGIARARDIQRRMRRRLQVWERQRPRRNAVSVHQALNDDERTARSRTSAPASADVSRRSALTAPVQSTPRCPPECVATL
jgi:hypothetical protein